MAARKKTALVFNDFTVLRGAVYSRRVQDTAALAPEAMTVCRRMLANLRRGELAEPQPIEDLPPFVVTLGPPEWLREQMGERVEAAGRFFCCAAPGQPPFQVNYVLPEGPFSESDEKAAGTLLALSLTLGRPPRGWDVEQAVGEITEARPVLATTLLPVTLDMDMVRVAADFCTCFAAALLLEDKGNG